MSQANQFLDPPIIDDVRRFWDSRPCNIRHSSREVGTEEYYREVSARRYFVEPHIKDFAEFSKWKGKRVLEVGCGIGTDAAEFARAGAEYHGIDLSQESLKVAKRRFDVEGLQGTFFEANAESFPPLVSGKFDLIYSFGVIHHTPNIVSALSSIAEVSQPGTRVKVMVYAKHSLKQVLINEGLDQPEAQFGCPIANSYSKEEIQDLFHRSGLKVEQIRQAHIFPYDVESYKKGIYQKHPWFEAMPSELFTALSRGLGWHLLIDAGLA